MFELLQTPVDFIFKLGLAAVIWFVGSRWGLDLFLRLVTKIPKFPMKAYGPIRVAFLVFVGYVALRVLGLDLSAVFGFVQVIAWMIVAIVLAGIMLAFALSKRGQELVASRVSILVRLVEDLLPKK